jgi:hypothetical protein
MFLRDPKSSASERSRKRRANRRKKEFPDDAISQSKSPLDPDGRYEDEKVEIDEADGPELHADDIDLPRLYLVMVKDLPTIRPI